MFDVTCPDCNVAMEAGSDSYICPRCGKEIFMGKVFAHQLHLALKKLKAQFGKLSLSELKKRAWDENDPFTATVITVLAWFVARQIAIPFILTLLGSLSILLGPFGLALAVVVPIIVKRHQRVIEKRAREQQVKAKPQKKAAAAASRRRTTTRRPSSK
jgi:hypothetical protein